MLRITSLLATAALAFASLCASAASEFGTIDEARALVKKAQDTQIFSPTTKKVEPKRIYWERHGDLIVASGAYAK